VALGMTIVIATRGIDLSVGAIMAVSGAVAMQIIAGSDEPNNIGVVAVAVAVALVVSLILGAWNGFLVSVIGIQPIIATLVLMLAGRGFGLLITDGEITTVTSSPYKFLSTGYVFFLPVAFLLAMASGILAGIAGILYTSNISAADANNSGLLIELYAILAVVLGGTSLMGGKFSIAGTVIGVLFIQTLDSTILFLGISSDQSPVFFALVVIIVVLIQSPRMHAWGRAAFGGRRKTPISRTTSDVEVAA
jgi:ribose/xylose/arabinose/galactoside ABC-type transport system permease subunit